jgi:hypothetical protein
MPFSSQPTRFELTDEQGKIVSLGVDTRLLVTAGPGTGKTHTLIARIAELVSTHRLAPGQEILVLSFSRAAVREIRTRCRKAGGELDYISVSTFDSFSTRLLAELDPDGPWTEESFDGRILCAVELLRTSKEARDYVGDVRHILVDEVQDLVGIRAELVKALLEITSGGFSLFGDPAQGIYNFQLEGSARDIGSAALYEWIRARFAERLEECTLSLNHRALREKAMTALWAGPLLNDPAQDHAVVHRGLMDDINRLPSLGPYKQAGRALSIVTERTAILCRTNGQALMVSRSLWEQGVHHLLQRRATDRYLPRWIAQSLRGLDSVVIDRSSLAAKLASLDISADETEPTWRLLKRAERGPGTTISLSRLNLRCRQWLLPDELYEQIDAMLTISSVHRAKGLEFDRVIVGVGPEREAEYPAEEARTLYVALTRPKRDLLQIEIPACRGLMLHQVSHRWLRRWDWKTPDFEITFEDTDRTCPPDAVTSDGPTIPDIQDYIAAEVTIGDEVVLDRIGVNDRNPNAVFHLLHGGKVVGKTSQAFAATLFHILREGWNNAKLPRKIETLRIAGVETVFGDPMPGRNAGLGSSGTWLSVRVSGLGRLIY